MTFDHPTDITNDSPAAEASEDIWAAFSSPEDAAIWEQAMRFIREPTDLDV